MALFGGKKGLTSEVNQTYWTPKVDLNTARPVIFALANTPVSNDMQVRSAIADFVRLSGTPSSEDAYRFAQALSKALLHLAEGRRRRVAKWSLFPCSGL